MTDGGSLAIDAGQSGIKVRHADAAGASEWSGPGIRTDLPLLPQLARVIEDAVEAGRAFDVVGLGVSGLTSEESDAGYLLAAAVQHGVRAVHLAHDSITAYLGALGDDRGVVVASGTGVVTLAVGRTEVARVDGWGYLIGDAGSGYWLGRAALDAVMRAHDGRGEPTALTDGRARRVPRPRARLHRPAVRPRARRAHRRLRTARRRGGGGRRRRSPSASSTGRGASSRHPRSRAFDASARRMPRRPACAPSAACSSGAALARAFTAAVLERLPDADLRIGEAHPLDGAAALAAVAPTQRARGSHRHGGGDGFVRLLTAAPPTTILRRVGGSSLVGLHGERRPSVPHPVHPSRRRAPARRCAEPANGGAARVPPPSDAPSEWRNA